MKANNAAARLGGIVKTALEISGDRTARTLRAAPDISCVPTPPPYLETVYWWVYLHPRAVWVFERQWLVDAILWGNYPSVRDSALDALGDRLPGRTLQIACAYGDISNRLCLKVLADSGRLDIVDALPVQLENLRKKLPTGAPVRLAVDGFGRARLSRRELRSRDPVFPAARAARGVAAQYARRGAARRQTRGDGSSSSTRAPALVNPVRYLLRPLLHSLEPFALELWRSEIATWLPSISDEP